MVVIRWRETCDGCKVYMGEIEVAWIYPDPYASSKLFVEQHDVCPTMYARAQYPHHGYDRRRQGTRRSWKPCCVRNCWKLISTRSDVGQSISSSDLPTVIRPQQRRLRRNELR